jgi:hypothetical protein
MTNDDRRAKQRGWVLAVACVSILGLTIGALQRPAEADDRLVVPTSSVWQKECGACHLAYPPSLLPARSWRAIMGTLDKHYGTDASLDAKSAAEVSAVLEQYAGRDRGVTATNRITDTAWFRREHREVPAATWKHAEVKSAANCGACHQGADRGDYGERSVRLPR